VSVAVVLPGPPTNAPAPTPAINGELGPFVSPPPVDPGPPVGALYKLPPPPVPPPILLFAAPSC